MLATYFKQAGTGAKTGKVELEQSTHKDVNQQHVVAHPLNVQFQGIQRFHHQPIISEDSENLKNRYAHKVKINAERS